MAAKVSKEVRRRQRAEKKRLRARNRRGQAVFPKWARRNLPFENAEICSARPGQLKMSEVILRFADPLLDVAESDDEFYKGVSVAVLAWNLSLFADGSWKNILRERLSKSSSFDEIAEMESVFAFLIERKMQLYPSVHRIILDYQITQSENARHVNVVSTVLEPGPLAAQSTELAKASSLSAANLY